MVAFFSADGALATGDFIFALYLAGFACYMLMRIGFFAQRVQVRFAGPNAHTKRERLRTTLKRDRFLPLDDPTFVRGSEARDMDPEARVVGVVVGGVAKAYPVSLMSLREVANDTIDGLPVAVTWSPVCYAPRAFVRRAPAGMVGQEQERTLESLVGPGLLEFGNSGKLVLNSSVYYDRDSESLWLQFLGQAIYGPYEGWWLEPVPAVNASWRTWLDAYPDTLVVDDEEDPNVDLFDRYYRSDRSGLHKQSAEDRRLGDKEVVLGVEANEDTKAYPFAWLIEEPLVEDEIGGEPVVVVLERISATARAFDPRVDGRTLTFDEEGANPRRPEEPEETGEDADEDREAPEIPFEPLFLRDRETGSRWRAVSGECVEGELQGKHLQLLPASMGFWFAWSRFYPGAGIMSLSDPSDDLEDGPFVLPEGDRN